MIYQFENASAEDRYLIPFEAKFLVTTRGKIAFSANTMLSYFNQNDDFGSFNTSLGMGISFAKENKSPLQGLYWTVYPVYELPAITGGKSPIVAWKSAFDMGMGFNFLSETDIYISIYSRMICFWTDRLYPFGAVPDFGIAAGWHFQDKMYIDKYIPVPLPETSPEVNIDSSTAGRLTIWFKDSGSRRRKPAGARNVEIRWEIRDTPPASADELEHTDTDKRSPYIFHFDEAPRGKTLCFCLRWVNYRDKESPWGEVYSVIIP
ncbi:MAG: hypothetical protein MdMp014T_2341 [Treponematales bacterium]